MKWSDLPLNPTSRMLRQFAGAWVVVFAALALRQWFGRGHPELASALGAISIVGVIGLVQPKAMRWLFIAATVLAFPIGWVVTQFAVALMFFLVLTPIALVFRWTGRDALQLRRKSEAKSCWREHTTPSKPERYLKQF